MNNRYDDTTKKFMDDVSSKEPVHADPGNPTLPLKQAVAFTKAVISRNPKDVGLLAVRGGIGALSRETFSKTSAENANVNILSIYHQMTDKYDKDWFDWEPETVTQTLYHDYGVDMGDEGKNIVGALQLILNTNQAHEHWHIFEKVGHAFNGNVVDFSVLHPLSPEEVALTLAIINHIRPKETYDREIHAYIAASGRNTGMVFLPKEFFGEEAQKFLDEMNNDLGLKALTENHWNSRDKKLAPADQALLIQIQGLNEIKDYLEENHVSS